MVLRIAALPEVRGAACHVPCFSQGFHSRQLLCPATRFVQSSFIALHCAAFAQPPHTLVTFGLWSITHPLAHNHKLHSLQRKAHSTPFRFIHFLFHSASCSPPAALVVLACAVVRAAGCHDFCIPPCWPSLDQSLSTTHRSKQKITPALVRCGRSPTNQPHIPRGLPHGSLPHSLRASVHAPCSHPTSCSRLTPWRPLRSPWASRMVIISHRTSDAHTLKLRNNILYFIKLRC